MEQSTSYIRGFNQGYQLRKNHPLLMKSLVKGATGKSEFLDGLKAGGIQYEKEMGVKMKEFKQENISIQKGKDKGLNL